jgi:hypothetical protein
LSILKYNADTAFLFFSIDSGDEWSLGKSSQVRHYTVKEYEDHLHQLRNENFHLKLRIYFLEQGTTHPNAANNKQDPMDKNVDLKVKCSFSFKSVLFIGLCS